LNDNPADDKREALAGSADDRAVTLPAASADETTLTAQGQPGGSSVEKALRAAGAEAGRYVEQSRRSPFDSGACGVVQSLAVRALRERRDAGGQQDGCDP